MDYASKYVDKLSIGKFNLDFGNGPLIMGILNITPDSFSDGGHFSNCDEAIAHGLKMANQGAVILDIGPESSRPGSQRVSVAEQIKRATPVIEKLCEKVCIPISIDTYESKVAAAAIYSGASIINDITAGSDPGMFRLAAARDVPIVLMHMKGSPDNMQINPTYGNVVEEVLAFLLSRADAAMQAGIKRERIVLDPGIGFGKTTEHNLALIASLKRFVDTGFAIVLGASRKRFIGQITGRYVPTERMAGTISTTIAALNAGVQIVRVHDVPENLDAIKVAMEIKRYDAICRKHSAGATA